jgi:transposase-like protein
MDASLQEKAEQLATEFAAGATSVGELNALFRAMMKRGLETMLDAEMDHHLESERHLRSEDDSNSSKRANCRNGRSRKKVQGELGPLEIEAPRDRQSTFEPQIVGKHQRRVEGFDEKLLALYAKGMTTRDIQEIVKELYGVEVSADLISRVTEDLDRDLKEWQSRPLPSVFPIVFFDGIVVHVRGSEGKVSPHTVYVALGIDLDGKKELLGLWIAKNEGAKFWLACLTDLRNRGLEDIFICCVDGLAGFPEAIRAAYPQARVQLCLVHLVRAALRYVSTKDSKAVAADLKKIYTSPTVAAAEEQLAEFAKVWDAKYPTISKQWQSKWPDIISMFDFPEDIRRATYTTNAIESLNSAIRKFTKNRKQYPSEQSALKLVYMAIREASKRWTRPIKHWKQALNHFAVLFPDRMPKEYLS